MPYYHYKAAIDACVHCGGECDHFANQFAGSSGSIVRLCQDTAVLCWTTAAFLSRGSHFFPSLCQICAHACQVCADECERHPDMSLARCAEACRACAEQCSALAAEQPPQAAVLQGSGVSGSFSPAI